MIEGQVKEGMPCPVCRVDLLMNNRQGVEIDYCPRCRGVWLDRGELDKIVERSAMAEPAPAERASAYQDDRRFDRRGSYGDDRRHARNADDERQGRGSWLDDIFNFGD